MGYAIALSQLLKQAENLLFVSEKSISINILDFLFRTPKSNSFFAAHNQGSISEKR